jgi:hypothetical protein
MARTYTTRTLLPLGQAKEEDFNSEIMGAVQEFNGQLDGHQLPLQQITASHIKQPTASTQYINIDGTYSTYMTTQSYHQSEHTVGNTLARLEYNNPLWQGGNSWIRLRDVLIDDGVNVGGAQLTFNALEGMLVGNAVIDFFFDPGEYEVTLSASGTPVTADRLIAYDEPYYIEWGVFIDDVCVSQSGLIWPRRMTLNLPFNAPVSSKLCKIDIRFKIGFADTVTLFTQAGYTLFREQGMQYNGGNLWVRNQYR